MADKYIVFKVDPDADKYVGPLVDDAVVIRDQDAFAPQIHYTYAAAAQNVIEILERILTKLENHPAGDVVEMIKSEIDDLGISADFFRNRAEIAEHKVRKLPTP